MRKRKAVSNLFRDTKPWYYLDISPLSLMDGLTQGKLRQKLSSEELLLILFSICSRIEKAKGFNEEKSTDSK